MVMMVLSGRIWWSGGRSGRTAPPTTRCRDGARGIGCVSWSATRPATTGLPARPRHPVRAFPGFHAVTVGNTGNERNRSLGWQDNRSHDETPVDPVRSVIVKMPPAEIDLTVDLVHALLRAEHPGLDAPL